MNRPSPHVDAGSAELQGFLVANRPRLKRLLAAHRVPPEDAEDLLQDALLVLVLRWDHMDGIVSPEGWLLGTLRLTIRQYWRRRSRERRLLDGLAPSPAGSEAAPQERRDTARDVRSLCAALPWKARRILWLRYGEELAPRDTARALGCQPDSVRRLARRALERVRKQLAAAAPED
jgi:RNA polymerase sigma factor (sigma-70 family)